MGDIMSESMGGIIPECPGDFVGIRSEGYKLLFSHRSSPRWPAVARVNS